MSNNGQIAGVTDNLGGAATYVYDGNSLRVQKTAARSTTVYLFSGSKLIQEYSNGALSRQYVYAGSRRLATLDAANSVLSYEHPDHLSLRVQTNAAGASIAEYGHAPFGETWYATGADRFQFTTYDRDPAAGLDYAIMRWHSRRMGRFTSPDLLAGNIRDPQSLDRYSYAANDPIDLVDLLGLDYFWQNGCLYYEEFAYVDGVKQPGSTIFFLGCYDLRVNDRRFEIVQQNNACPGCSKPNQTVRQCADDIAKHWSVAGMAPLPDKYQDTFAGGFYNGLFGNTWQGISDLRDSVATGSGGLTSNYGGQLAGNISQGIPLPGNVPAGAKGPVGVILDHAAPWAGRVLGFGKFGLDSAVYAAALSFCSTGKY